jgi:hypothetical protein
MLGPVMEGGEEIDGGVGAMVAPVDALPGPESSGDPKRLGGVPTMLGVGVIGLGGAPMKLVDDGSGERRLGGVPTIGAEAPAGVPTLPMALPGVAPIDGGAPTLGAPPRGTPAWPKAPIGGDNSATTIKGAARVRCNMADLLSFMEQAYARAVPPAAGVNCVATP